MPVRRDERNGQWRYRKVVKLPDGRRVRVSGSPSVNTRAAAEAAERAHIARLVTPELDKSKKKEVPTLQAFVPEFMETYVRANNKPSERMAKEYIFRRHLLPAFGRRRLDDIGTRDIEKFKADKLTEVAPKSVNNFLTCLGKTLRYAAETEIIDKIPRIRFVKVCEQPFDFLDFEEYGRLVDAASADPETLPAILLGGDAGLRVGEIRALEWGDLDLVAGRIIVQRTDYRGYLGSPKGGRTRRIPMTARLRAALKAARHLRGSLVFSDADGKMWTRGEADTPLRRAIRKSGLRAIGWHTLRHTFCSHLAMRGAPIRTIQELAGHASITTTMRYMHLTQSAADDAIRLLDQPLGQPVPASGSGISWQQRGNSGWSSGKVE